MMKKPKLNIAFTKAHGINDIGTLCRVSYKGISEDYVNSTKEACLVDFIEDLIGVDVKIIEKE